MPILLSFVPLLLTIGYIALGYIALLFVGALIEGCIKRIITHVYSERVTYHRQLTEIALSLMMAPQ